MPPPITPLLRAGAQAARIAEQAARRATTAAPGLVQGALGAARRTQQGVGGLTSRMSQLASNPALRAAGARVQPRAMNALAQLQQMRQPIAAALQNPAAAAFQGVDRAAQVTSGFLQALQLVEHSATFQRFAGPRLNAALHEAQAGLHTLENFLQSAMTFGEDAGKLIGLLGGGTKPARPDATPPQQPQPLVPPRPSRPPTTPSASTSPARPTPQASAARPQSAPAVLGATPS